MFQSALAKIVDGCEGAQAAVLMGFDGIPVAHHPRQAADEQFEALTTELCAVLSHARKVAGILSVGDLNEVAIRAEAVTFIARVITDEYFIGLTLRPDGNLGKGRYLVRMAAPEICAQL